MQCVLLLAVIALGSSQHSFCNSFQVAGIYYDVGLGVRTDRTVLLPNATFQYNLCDNVAAVCEVLAPSSGVTSVIDYQGSAILRLSNSLCVPFTNQSSVSLLNASDPGSGIQLLYSSAPVNGTTYIVSLISYCGTSQPSTVNGSTYFLASGIDGCPKIDLTTLWDFFTRNLLAFFITTEVLGVVLMVLGIYLYRITLLLLGTLAAFFILIMVESIVVFQPGVPNELISSIIIITIITSVLAGYVTLYFPKVGLFVLGMWVGFFLSFILNNIALYHIVSNPPALPLMITMGILGIGMGVLSLFIKKTFVIVSTSFIGAYSSIRALSWYLGKYPNEFLIAKEFHTQTNQVKVQWQYYIYVVALAILTSSSIAVQFWIFRRKSKMLGKTADVDQYIGKIEEDLDLERSKFIKLDNIFKKENGKLPKARFLKRRQSQDEQDQSRSEGEPEEEEETPKNRAIPRKGLQNDRKPAKARKSDSGEEEHRSDDQQQEPSEDRSRQSAANRESQQQAALRERLLTKNRRK